MDIFDILGPVMVGPSSSHTAGAARIGKMARTLLGGEPIEARIHLHGSFAETGSGHGTDRALVAGLLGMNPDDMRIPFAFQEAEKAGLHFTVDKIDLRDAHPNTAVIEVRDAHGKQLELQAASIGGGRIVICDYKNGAGVPVEAEHNSQMMLYALGALASFRPIYGDTITTAHMVIIQPHAGGVKEWEISVEDLTRWGHEVVAPRAKTALEGAEPARPGDWCRFCKGKSQCAARAKQMLEVGKQYQMAPAAGSEKLPPKYDGPLLSDEEVGAALSAGAGLAAWYKDLQDYALLACLDGREIPGFKAVEGRGSRDWGDDPDAAFRILQERGVAEAMLYERKPVTAPALEKALGKKLFAEVADGLVRKQQGKPTLVPASDKRPPYNAAEAAFQPVPDNG